MKDEKNTMTGMWRPFFFAAEDNAWDCVDVFGQLSSLMSV